MANTSLTDTLNDPSFTPQVVGGTGGGSMIGGLAKLGSNFLDNLDQQERRAASAAGSHKDETAVNEAAYGAFKILSGNPGIGEDGDKALNDAERFQKAFKAGSMGDTKYDLAMKNWYANVLNRHPDKANDILQEGAARGFDHFYFREAQTAQTAADAAVARQVSMDNKALELAGSKGQLTGNQGYDVMTGYSIMNSEAERAELNTYLDKIVKTEGLAEPERKRMMGEIQTKLGDNFKNTVFKSIDVTMQGVIYPLVRSGNGTLENKKQLQDVFGSGIMQLQAMRSNVQREALTLSQDFEYTVPDPSNPKGEGTKVTRSMTVPQEAIDQTLKEIDAQIDVFKWLQTADNEKIKNYIDSTTLNDKTSANQYIPNILRMSNSWGMTVPAILETLSVSPGTLGLSASQAKPLLDELAANANQFSTQSIEFMHQMTTKGQSPALSKNPAEAAAGYMYNARVATMMGDTLMKGTFTNDADRQAAVKNFEDNASSLIVATRTQYSAANINNTNAGAALEMLFNDRNVGYLDAYTKNGGDADTAKMMGTQLGIGAGQFLEALNSSPNDAGDTVTYNKATGSFEAKGSNVVPIFGVPFLGAPNPGGKASPATQSKVRTMNGLLDFIEKNNTKYPILKEDHLKASGRSIRDVAAGEGFDAYAKTVLGDINKIEQERKQTQQNFDSAVSSFKNGGFDTNPFDNGPNANGIEVGSALDFIHQQEGSGIVYDNPDSKEATNFGIRASTLAKSKYKDIPISQLTQAQADDIYQEEYIQPVLDAGVPPEAQLAVIDSAVNQGLRTALSMWDLSDGNLEEFTKKRLARYKKTSGWDKYGDAWTKRTLQSAGLDKAPQ